MWSFQHFYPLLSCSSEVSIHLFIFTRYREWFSVTFPDMQRIFTHTCKENCFLPPFLCTCLSLGKKRERECGEWYCFSIATGTPLPRHEAQMVLSLLSPVFFCELLWLLWSRIWVCISLISVASVVSIFFCWPTHYIFTWILTTVWPYLPQVCTCSPLVFHCRHLFVLGFQVSCFSCHLQLMINCKSS